MRSQFPHYLIVPALIAFLKVLLSNYNKKNGNIIYRLKININKINLDGSSIYNEFIEIIKASGYHISINSLKNSEFDIQFSNSKGFRLGTIVLIQGSNIDSKITYSVSSERIWQRDINYDIATEIFKTIESKYPIYEY